MLMARTLLFYVLFSFSFGATSQDKDRILIGAASDLKFALDSVITRYVEQYSGDKVDVAYSSSGKLFEQIAHGAPYDLFFSADKEYPARLKMKGLVIGQLYTYGVGRIVLWSKKIDPNKDAMESVLDPAIGKISMANPLHAPYGKRAEEALTYYGLHEKVSSRLVFGENISQAAQFITSGAADVGIIALSLATSPAMQKENGNYFLIPAVAHSPLEQAFVLLTNAKGNSAAITFKDFMLSDEAKRILRHFGFAEMK
jgi:molybdate transport system substrate-binding protein